MVTMLATDVAAQHRDGPRRDELAERIACALRTDGTAEPLAGLHLHRMSQPTERVPGVSTPSFCIIAQGSKKVYLGEKMLWLRSAPLPAGDR